MTTSKTDKICVRSEDFIKAAMLAVILHYSLTRWYHWGKLDKRYLRSLCILSYNSLWIDNFLKVKV